MGEGMRRSLAPVSILLGVLMMMALVLSSIVYNIEYYNAMVQPGQGFACDDEVAWEAGCVDGALVCCPSFATIPETFYWAITTMTTVGYGDLSPKSAFGRIIAMLTMYAGIPLLALP